MTINPVLTCYGIILLLTAPCLGGRQHGIRKIRHDHKTQVEGTQPADIDFEFETKEFQFDYDGEYDGDPSEEVTLVIVHSLFDTRNGVVPNIIYQGTYNKIELDSSINI